MLFIPGNFDDISRDGEVTNYVARYLAVDG
jgi:hypothetical protein